MMALEQNNQPLSKLSVIKLTPDNDTISLRNSPLSSNLSNFPADTISTHTQHSQTITGKSFYSLSKSISPKVSKGGTAIYTASGQLMVALEQNNQPLKIHNYLIQNFDKIIYDSRDQLNFESSLELSESVYQSISNLPSSGLMASHVVNGVFQGNLVKGVDYPLPLSTPIEEKNLRIQVDAQSGVELGYYYDSYRKQVFFRLLQTNSRSARVKINYQFLPDARYNLPTLSPKEIKDNGLPEPLRLKLEKVVNDDKDLQFLLKEISLVEKLDQLQKFLQKFRYEKVNTKFKDGTLEALLANLKHRRGACAQRSQIFMLLGRLAGAEINLIQNETHQFCHVRNQDGSLTCMDFGGATGQNAPGVNRDIKGLFKQQPPTIAPLLPTERIANEYEEKIHASLTHYPCFDFKEFKSDLKPVLIHLPKGMTTLAARKQFFDWSGIPEPYVYLENPSDFKRYLQTYRLENSRRVSTLGPLQKIFNEGGYVFINWSQFLPIERVRYQSLLAEIKGQIKTVGFLADDNECPPEFINAYREYHLPESSVETKDEMTSITAEPIVVDLYQESDAYEPDWYELLVADLQYSATGEIKSIDGPLLRAIAENRPLKICRPPTLDPEFEQFWQQLQIEKRFWFNGEWVYTHNIPITLSTTRQIPIEDNIAILPPETEYKASEIYLHNDNWHTLYEEIQYQPVDNSKQFIAVSQPGKLVTNANNNVVFVVTENISSGKMQRVNDFIRDKNIQGNFRFYSTSKTTTPIKSKKFQPKEFVDHKASQCFFSNDPEYATRKLYQWCVDHKQEPAIIDLTPDMEDAQLLEKIVLDPTQTQGVPQFTREELGLLTALKKGRTVILKGTISKALMQVLLPLFSKHPYLEINGQRVEIPGRIYLVQPEKAKPATPSFLPSYDYCFADANYCEDLLEEKISSELLTSARKKMIDDILLFFNAGACPHHGSGMPESLGKCWQSLSHLYQILLSKPRDHDHSHNPVKGAKLYDYEVSGEYYAFLNVLLKFLFDKNSENPIRIPNFQDLKRKIANKPNSGFAWRLLNTCNGKTLREILGENWLSQNKDQLYTQMTGDHWKIINEKFQQKYSQFTQPKIVTSSKVKTDRTVKIQKRLQYLINHESNPVIVVKGEPGVGKTHYLDHLKNNPDYHCAVGLDEIEKWIAGNQTGKKNLLLLDEANIAKPGMLDFLNGIHRTPRVIFYKGQWHELTDNHKIVAAVNPESFSGRYFHDLLRHGNTELVKMPSPESLARTLVTTYQLELTEAQQIVAGAELFKRYQPLVGYSFRSLKTAVERYQALVLDPKISANSKQQILAEAIYGEYGLTISEVDQRHRFKTELLSSLKIKPEVEAKAKTQMVVVNNKAFAPEMTDAHIALRQSLLIRNKIIASGEDKDHRRGLLLQSARGAGKWTLTEACLQAAGLQPDKDYSVMTGGEDQDQENFRKKVREIFNRGGILIIKNIDFLKPEQEGFLGSLLTGKDGNKAAENPGFFVIGLKSTDRETGAHARSPALQDRMPAIHVPEYADHSWEQLALWQLGSKDKAQKLVESVWSPVKPYPRRMTGHYFFKYLNQFKQEQEPLKLDSESQQLVDSKIEIQNPPPENVTGSLANPKDKLSQGLEIFSQASDIKKLEDYLDRTGFTPPKPLINADSKCIISLCLYRLVFKRNKLKVQCSALAERRKTDKLYFFQSMYITRELEIKERKTIGLEYLINNLLQGMMPTSGENKASMNVGGIVEQTIKSHPALISGTRSETESEILDLLKFYQRDHLHLSVSTQGIYRPEIRKAPSSRGVSSLDGSFTFS